METNRQREERVIKRTLDRYVEDNEVEEADKKTKELLVLLVPESYTFYWDYYKAKKRER